MKRLLFSSALIAATTFAGCAKKASNSPCDVPFADLAGKSCDPMVPEQCGFPFPSNVYLQKDTSNSTCGRVMFTADMLPAIAGAPANPAAWSDSDGFSPGSSPITYIKGATTAGVPDQNHIADSLTASSPTVLLDTSTNPPTRVAHFAELDLTSAPGNVNSGGIEYDTGDQAFMIRPAIRLKDATRYIVAISNVKDINGNVIAPSPVFQALRDGTASSDPTVASRKALYADIFSKLKAAGVDQSSVQIAWDFTTASKENLTNQLVSMRDQALAAVGSAGPSYTITGHTDMPDATNDADHQFIARTIQGTIHVPLFLDHGAVTIDTNTSDPDITTGYVLQKDANGNPKMNGYADYQFMVQIPLSVWNDTKPAPILIQGHGLFSDRSEGQASTDDTYNYLVKLANEDKYITVAVDLVGWRTPGSNTDPLQEDDQEKAQGFVLATADNFRRMVDRGTQGMLNQLVAVRAMKTSLGKDALMVNSSGQPVVDTSTAYYRGDSMGGCYGTTFMSLSQDVTRGYLGEAGLPFGFIIMRSTDFAPFLEGLLLDYQSSARTVQLGVQVMQMFWDRLEGDGFVPYLSTNLLPNTPAHHVLINDNVGDFQVTPLGAEILARTIGAQTMDPVIRDVYGIPESAGPVTGNGILEFDFGVESDPNVTIPMSNTPPSCTDAADGSCSEDPHDKTRLLTPVYTETDAYFRTGVATNECSGTCVFPVTSP